MFPFSIRGSINIETNQPYSPELEQALLNRFHARLQKENARKTEIDKNALHFKRGFPGLFDFKKLLEIIDRETITTEPDGMGLRVEYQLWFTWFIIQFTIVFGFIEYTAYIQGSKLFSMPQDILLWLGVLAGNMVIAVIRFRIMLRAEISKV